MRIVNEFHEEIENFTDFAETEGALVKEKITVHKPEIKAQAEVSHFERIIPKNFEKIVDKPEIKFSPAHDEEEEVLVYKAYTPAEKLRRKREKECFPIINRGKLWYSLLTFAQETELLAWYKQWLDAPETLVEPTTPKWVNEKIKFTEEIL